jgi:hypothetical protein
MTTTMLRAVLCGAALCLLASATPAQAQEYYPAWHHPWRQTTAPLFSNYYVAPPTTCGVPAALYVSPRPVPANVGHTYVTNQAFMPNEWLYKHHRTYYAWHNRGGNYTKTRIWWW